MDPSALAAELAKPRIPGVVAAPYAEGRTIGSILPTVMEALGAKPGASQLPPLRDLPAGLLRGVERVVLLTLDGWGWHQLARHLQGEPRGGWARIAAKGHLQPLTTVAPSTTAAALASLNTGLAPAQHGLLGYNVFVRDFGGIVNMLKYAPVTGGWGFDSKLKAEAFFPHPTAARLLESAGAKHLNVTRREFLGSPLTRMLYQGGEAVGTVTLGELLVELRFALEAMPGDRGLVQGYWPAIDTVAHARGPASAHHEAEMALLGDALARELLDKVHDAKALLLVTADHGLVTVPPEGMLKVREHPDLADLLRLPPWGDSRWSFLQPLEGCHEEVRDLVVHKMGPGTVVLPIGEVERLGLLGPMGQPWPAETRRRAADLVVVSPPGKGVTWPWRWPDPGRPEGQRDELVGRHGGASAEEMLVPLLALRFGGA